MAITERLAILVEANAGKAIAEFKKVSAASKNLGGDAEAAGGKVGLLGRLSGENGALLKTGVVAGAAVAGAALVKFGKVSVDAFLGLNKEVKAFQRVAGGTTEDASRLVAAFSAVGVDAQTAANGVFMLEKKLGASGQKLAEFGITAVRGKNGLTDMTQTILGVGDAYRKTVDPIQRAALLTAAFGRQGQALAPLLGKSREEIEKFFKSAEKRGLIVSPEDQESARRFNLAVHELGDSLKGLEVEAGRVLVPFLTTLTETITKIVDLGHKVEGIGHFKILGVQILTLAKIASVPLTGGLSAAAIAVGQLGDKSKDTAAQEKELAAAMEDASATADAQSTDLQKAIFAVTTSQRAAAEASRSLDAARRSEADAQADLNKLLKEGAVDAQKVADAQRALADANRAVGHAQREQAKAQTEYNAALADATDLKGLDTAQEKLAGAKDNLADANDSVADAQNRAKDAQVALAKAQAGDPDFQTKLADARQKVADAHQSVADAIYNVSQRAYEANSAIEAQTQAFSDDADQVDRLFASLTGMMALHPELSQFLAGPIANLGPQASGPQGASGFFGDIGRIQGAVSRLQPPAAPVKAPVINQTFNTQVDPIQVANHISWALN